MANPKPVQKVRMLLLSVLLFSLCACSAVRWEDDDGAGSATRSAPRAPSPQSEGSSPRAIARPATVTSLLNDYYRDWRGTPYQFGGTSRRGIDCSAFTQQAMSRALGITLPRTTGEQIRQGRSVTAAQLRSGDLVFFKTGETLNHVGVMMGPAKFMHASTKNGVTLSRLDDKYWSARVIGYRRVIQ